jgi:hypothetical protein
MINNGFTAAKQALIAQCFIGFEQKGGVVETTIIC